MQPLKPIPYPVYFVNPESPNWTDLLNCDELPSDIEGVYKRCITGEEIWTAQTFVYLKQRGLDVHFVDKPVVGQICIIPSDYLHIKLFAFNSYVVGLQTDRARPGICEQRIVLNPVGVKEAVDHFTHHWHHPMLQPRDRTRGNKVETLGFKGLLRNLAAPFHEPEFSRQLNLLGVDFNCSPEDPDQQMRIWGDYRQIDVVLGVRSATWGDLSLKPAVKLLNAWRAGCPAILGPEQAYAALRRSELDYIEVRTAQEVIEAIERLKEQPKLYEAMVQNGLERAEEVTVDRIASYWRELLAGPIAQGYEQWKQQSPLFKWAGRPVQYLQRVRKHKRYLKIYLYNREHGDRPFPPNQSPVQPKTLAPTIESTAESTATLK